MLYYPRSLKVEAAHVAFTSQSSPSHRDQYDRLEARTIIMANQRPPFRPTFSLLLASGLLLAQPASSLAASQVECRPSSDGRGWACNPLETTSQLPPRPQAPVVRASEPAQQPVSTEQPRQPAPAEQRRVVDFSELDWVPRDQLTAAQRAAIAPFCSGDYKIGRASCRERV